MQLNVAFIMGLMLFGLTVGQPASKDFNPLRRVLTLLQDMTTQVQQEAKDDQSAYDKYACWCQTSDKEKTAAVENAEEKIAELEAFIAEAAGLEAQLKTEIQTLADDIAEDKDAIATATALREKENAEFQADEADMKECLGALHEAVKVLAKVQLLQKQKGSAAPETHTALLQLHHVVKDIRSRFARFHSVMQKDIWDVLSSLGADGAGSGDKATPSFLSQKRSMLLPWEKTEEQLGKEANPNGLVGAAAGAKSYNSRSGQILGLLSEMRDEFGRNLAAAQKEELDALISFQHLRSAKLGEIAAATKQKEQKEQQLADTIQKAAEAKENLESTKDALAADQKFLLFLAKTCKTQEEEYQNRSKIRSDELVALGETMKILTEDDTRDLFGRTLSLMETSAKHRRSVGAVSAVVAAKVDSAEEMQARRAQHAMRHILHAARKHKDWVLASLAVRVQLDAFTKVKVVMDKMTEELKAQQKAEYEKMEFCKAQIDETEDTIKVKNNEREDLEEKKKMLENAIATLRGEIETLNQEVADMEVSLKKAGEDRKSENQLFQRSVADQRATIQILQKALARLKQFYLAKGAAAALAQLRKQEPGAAVAPPPPKPAAYEKSAGAGGVLQMITMIIEDASREEVELVADEQSAQESYSQFASDATASIEADREAVVEKTSLVEKTSGESSETQGALIANGDDLATLDGLLKAHHLDCDFLIKYFNIRQQARQEEIGAIAEAKAILSGATFAKAADAADSAEE